MWNTVSGYLLTTDELWNNYVKHSQWLSAYYWWTVEYVKHCEWLSAYYWWSVEYVKHCKWLSYTYYWWTVEYVKHCEWLSTYYWWTVEDVKHCQWLSIIIYYWWFHVEHCLYRSASCVYGVYQLCLCLCDTVESEICQYCKALCVGLSTAVACGVRQNQCQTLCLCLFNLGECGICQHVQLCVVVSPPFLRMEYVNMWNTVFLFVQYW